MKLTLTPILLAIELAFLFVFFRRASKSKVFPPARLTAFWLWIVIYAGLATYLGYRGLYVSEALAKYLPGLWLQSVTVVACVGPVLLSAHLRDELRRAVDATKRESFIYFHMLRMAALGTLLGAAKQEFPIYFEVFVGLPDLAFALSSFLMLRVAKTGRLSDKSFLYWNLAGALVIVPAAPILLQLGLPGPLYYFQNQPDARAVFAFPMSIASIVGVPLFVLVNLLLVWRLLERRCHARNRNENS